MVSMVYSCNELAMFIFCFLVAMTVRSLFTYSARQINELEEKANENPGDPDVQAEYLKVYT